MSSQPIDTCECGHWRDHHCKTSPHRCDVCVTCTGFHSKKIDDPVNHPKHYTSHPSGVECITIARHHNFNVGNVIKYCWRAGLKDTTTVGEVQDLKKALWYLNDEIKRIEEKK